MIENVHELDEKEITDYVDQNKEEIDYLAVKELLEKMKLTQNGRHKTMFGK